MVVVINTCRWLIVAMVGTTGLVSITAIVVIKKAVVMAIVIIQTIFCTINY